MASVLNRGCGANELCPFVTIPRAVVDEDDVEVVEDDADDDFPGDGSSSVTQIEENVEPLDPFKMLGDKVDRVGDKLDRGVDKLDIIVKEFKLYNRGTQQRLKVERTTDRQDSVEREIERVKQFMDNQSRHIEYAVTWSVANLVKGNIVLTRYAFKGELKDEVTGDVDGMVIGQWEGADVLVCVEVKHCLSSRIACRSAVGQAEKAACYVEELRSLNPEELTGEDAVMLQDYENLQIEKYRSRKIILAFGAQHFPQHAAEYFPLLCKRREFILMTFGPQLKYMRMTPKGF